MNFLLNANQCDLKIDSDFKTGKNLNSVSFLCTKFFQKKGKLFKGGTN